MRFDTHTHSCFSFDGAPNATPEAMCRAAMEKGLDGIAITDHMDINRQVEGWGILLDPDAQWKGISEAKQVFDGLFQFMGIKINIFHRFRKGQNIHVPIVDRAPVGSNIGRAGLITQRKV